MSFPNSLLPLSTWHTLGLTLGTVMLALGTSAITKPLFAADTIGLTPTTPEGRAMVEKSMFVLAARDFCLGASLVWFWREGRDREMGILLTTGVVIFAADIWIAGQGPRGWDAGVYGLCLAAAVATGVGLGLLQA